MRLCLRLTKETDRRSSGAIVATPKYGKMNAQKQAMPVHFSQRVDGENGTFKTCCAADTRPLNQSHGTAFRDCLF